MTTQFAIRKNSRFRGYPVLVVGEGRRAKRNKNVIIRQLQGVALSGEWTIRDQQLIFVPFTMWLFYAIMRGWRMPEGGR